MEIGEVLDPSRVSCRTGEALELNETDRTKNDENGDDDDKFHKRKSGCMYFGEVFLRHKKI